MRYIIEMSVILQIYYDQKSRNKIDNFPPLQNWHFSKKYVSIELYDIK
jgi:hypothetical protein